MVIDYFSIQIAVSIIFCIFGAVAYTIGRFLYKDASIKNINDLLKKLDIPLLIEKLQFDNKFWKTCGVAIVASTIIVILSYQDVIDNIVVDENILVTAFKAFALGAFANLGINTIIKGNNVSGIIQAIITAMVQNNKPTEENVQFAKRLLQAERVKCRIVPSGSQE